MDSNPASFAAAVTASDSTTFDPPTRGLFIGGEGDLAVVMAGGDGSTVTFIGLTAPGILPLSVIKVMAATTATDIVRLW